MKISQLLSFSSVAIFSVFSLFACSDNVGGTTSNTENSIASAVYASNGAPLSARLNLRPLSYTPNNLDSSVSYTLETESDSLGKFNFEIPDSISDTLFFLTAEYYKQDSLLGIYWSEVRADRIADSLVLEKPARVKFTLTFEEPSFISLNLRGTDFEVNRQNISSIHSIPGDINELSVFYTDSLEETKELIISVPELSLQSNNLVYIKYSISDGFYFYNETAITLPAVEDSASIQPVNEDINSDK